MKRFGWQTVPLAILAIVVLAFGSSSFSSSAQAQQGKPDGGFSGFVSVLLGVAEVESQFQTDDDNRINTSLSSSGESSTVFAPAVPFELAYMVSDWNTQFYAGIPVENLREGAFFQWEAGARYWLADNTRLSASLVAPNLIVDETWSDPFLLNAPRSKTDIDSLGFKVRADNIAGSHWGLRYEFQNKEIDNEQSGQSLALSQSQLRLLERDANLHRVTATYAWPLGDGWWLRPALRYELADADGDSNSYNALRPEVGFFYGTPSYDLSIDLSYESRWFDKDNPIFGKARDDSTYRVTAAFGYKQPFGWEHFRFDVIGSFAYGDSDIDFYDNQLFYVGSGLTYTF
jgi:hypothetical protein